MFYELGVAHTLNKKVIIITENISSFPFDLKSYRAKEYSTHFTKFAELIEALDKYLHGAISGEVSTNLREYNSHYINLWNQVEKDILGLLENKYASQNKDELVSFLKSLKEAQNNIIESCEPVEEMKNVFLGNLGMERSLNQSIRFPAEDLESYLSIME